MSKIINVALVLTTLVLGYWLYSCIKDPISFNNQLETRKLAVIAKLKQIQSAQEIYRTVTGKYANNFDTLSKVIQRGKIEIVKLESDPTDPTNQDKFIKTVSYTSALDSLKSIVKDIDLDNLKYVPYTENQLFDIKADTLTYQSNLVNVVEVGTRYKDFMGEYADPKYKKYAKFYDPEHMLKFGDMNSPNTSGNW